MTTLLDGKVVSDKILDNLKKEIADVLESTGKDPGLAVILVGNNPASRTYVNAKKKACHDIGIMSFEYKLDEKEGQAALEKLIDHLNQDSEVHGILLQLPLPKGYDEQALLERIHPDKDVDGFHPFNMGRLAIGLPALQPCTPAGILKLLAHYQIQTEGKHVVVVGRSNIVGKPIALMLVQNNKNANATVTICHSKTPDIGAVTRQADILIAAVGKPEFITAEMVKPGATIIDVGINRVSAPNTKTGYKIVGDVHFDDVYPLVDAITPVPGGVGKMTIATLMATTLQTFRKQEGLPSA
jgi:methylenetetrahydrofolate dehydrogenase (NADP+) / methenyltetrahydrofolate cyclohydrolase